MLEAEGLQVEGKLLLNGQIVMNAPFIRQIEKLPFAAALSTSVIMSVFFRPALMVMGGIPNDLGVGTHQYIVTPAFQLLAAGGV